MIKIDFEILEKKCFYAQGISASTEVYLMSHLRSWNIFETINCTKKCFRQKLNDFERDINGVIDIF